jgi:hypothetical protein
MAYTASATAFHFEHQGSKFHVDVWTDFDELDVHLRRLDTLANKWEYVTSYVVPDNDVDGGFRAAISVFNKKLEELFPPKATSASTPEEQLRLLVRDGLTFNATTGQLEVK